MRAWWSTSRRPKSSERRVKLKPFLAAELLEPRCLLTDGATVGLPGIELPAGVVVVEASQWDDSGLTLRQIEGMIHVQRTGTEIDVIEPLPADSTGPIWIVGRDNASDVLTIDVSNGPAWLEAWDVWFGLRFFGGSGPQTDEMRFIEDSPFNVDLFAVSRGAQGNRIAIAAWPDWPNNGWEDWREATFDDVELVSCLLQLGHQAEWGPQCYVDFGLEDNVITIDQTDLAGGLVAITDDVTNFTLIGRPLRLRVFAGDGDDRIVVLPSVTQPPLISGWTGKDTIVGDAAFFDSWNNGIWSVQQIISGDTAEAHEAFANAAPFDWTTWISTGNPAPRSAVDSVIITIPTAESVEIPTSEAESPSDPELPPFLIPSDSDALAQIEDEPILIEDNVEPPIDLEETSIEESNETPATEDLEETTIEESSETPATEIAIDLTADLLDVALGLPEPSQTSEEHSA